MSGLGKKNDNNNGDTIESLASTMGGTMQNCYFEGSGGGGSGAIPALGSTMGRTAKFENVVIYVHNKATNASHATKKGVFNYYGSGSGLPSFSGLYVINDECDGVATFESTALPNINFYTSLDSFKSAVTSRPADISEKYWDILQAL